MSRPPHRRLALLASLIIGLATTAVLTLSYSVAKITETLPMQGLMKERDFSVLLLDVTRLEQRLTEFSLAPNEERRDALALAQDLVALRSQDNLGIYGPEDARVSTFHLELGTALGTLETILNAQNSPLEAQSQLLLPEVIQWRQLRLQAQTLSNDTFQASMEGATLQRAELSRLRLALILGTVLVALVGLTLVHLLLRQRHAYEQLRAMDDEMRSIAFQDPLTGLANRRLLTDRLRQAMRASERSGGYCAVLFMDLDNFKSLNDTLGHDVGDHLLNQVAVRLTQCVRAQDTVARLGGDEFVVLLEQLGESDTAAAIQAEGVAEKIRERLGETFALDGAEGGLHTSVSMGVTTFLGHESSIETLLKQADVALYQAKDGGRDTIRFFNPAMQAAVERRTRLEQELREAIERGEFHLHYQPLVNADGQVVGAEALLRWTRPDGRSVPPDEFIGVAEDTGLIVPLGRWVLNTACRQLRAWQAEPDTEHLTLSVNVSARQFRQSEFEDEVGVALDQTGADPAQLVLELTESAVLTHLHETEHKMRALGRRGIRFSLDDFGTGYSSLSYLKRLPFSEIKIDRSFVTDIGQDENDEAICAAIVTLARGLDLAVVAEGVETELQFNFLSNCHPCDRFQGYRFGHPMAAPALLERLRKAQAELPSTSA